LSEIIPMRIIERPPSAELRPDQTDQDSLPPYDVLDSIIQRYMESNLSGDQLSIGGIDDATIQRVVRLIQINEYKAQTGCGRCSGNAPSLGTRLALPDHFGMALT